jgi:hypothetical protein
VVREDLDPPGGVSWAKPQNGAHTDNNGHWRKYLEAIEVAAHARQRAFFADYPCDAWNACHAGEERLEGPQITYARETTLPDYRPPSTRGCPCGGRVPPGVDPP